MTADLVRKTLEPIGCHAHAVYTHVHAHAHTHTHSDRGSSNARQTNHQSSDAGRGEVKGVAGGSSGLAIKEATLIIDVCLRPKLGLSAAPPTSAPAPAPAAGSSCSETSSRRQSPVQVQMSVLSRGGRKLAWIFLTFMPPLINRNTHTSTDRGCALID